MALSPLLLNGYNQKSDCLSIPYKFFSKIYDFYVIVVPIYMAFVRKEVKPNMNDRPES